MNFPSESTDNWIAENVLKPNSSIHTVSLSQTWGGKLLDFVPISEKISTSDMVLVSYTPTVLSCAIFYICPDNYGKNCWTYMYSNGKRNFITGKFSYITVQYFWKCCWCIFTESGSLPRPRVYQFFGSGLGLQPDSNWVCGSVKNTTKVTKKKIIRDFML